MGRDTTVGAQSFAVYFFKALDWSLATTDPYLIQDISSPKCLACQAYIKTITDLASEGGHFDGGRLRVTGEQMDVGKVVPSDYVVKVFLNQDAGTAVRPNAPPSAVATAAPNVSDELYVSWTGNQWIAIEIA